MTACRDQVGIRAFTERFRDTHDYARRHARLPEQLPEDAIDYRSLLHRDGSVLSALNLQVCWLPAVRTLSACKLPSLFCALA